MGSVTCSCNAHNGNTGTAKSVYGTTASDVRTKTSFPALTAASSVALSSYINSMMTALTTELSTRGLSAVTWDKPVANSSKITINQINQIKTAINNSRTKDIANNNTTYVRDASGNNVVARAASGITKGFSWTDGTVTGSFLKANLPTTIAGYINTLQSLCVCNCNYCTCNCNYCTCNCNYCTCNCNYCTCNCDYCTCNCNYCTCNCQYSCTCNCNY